jgi:hypothetical protein
LLFAARLLRHPALTPNALAAELRIARQTATALLRELARAARRVCVVGPSISWATKAASDRFHRGAAAGLNAAAPEAGNAA